MGANTITINHLELRNNPDYPKLKAEASIRIPGVARLLIQGIQVIEGAQGLFVSWPSYRETKEIGSARFPLILVEEESVRWSWEIQILNEFREVLAEQSVEDPA